MDLYEFAYLDDSKVRQMVAGIDKGRVIQSKTTKAAKSNKGGKGAVKTPIINLEAGAASADEMTEEISTEFTAEGAFYRLRDFLSQRNEDEFISDIIDNVSIDDVERGDILELAGRLEVSPANELVSNLLRFIDSGISLGFLDAGSAKDIRNIRAIKEVLAANHISIVMNASENDMKALAVLDSSESRLRVPIEELNDEFYLLGKVIRIVKKGDCLDLTQFCMNPVYRNNRIIIKTVGESLIKLKEVFNERADLSELELSGPILVLSPIAIYR